jgi:virginiamycin B lyase
MLAVNAPLRARTQDAIALSGTVSSTREGLMEGVLVSAADPIRHMTITVVSDAHGVYRFPAKDLPPGQYELAIRAEGYDLADRAQATVAPATTAVEALRLVPTRDLAAQLTNTEWLQSFPGAAAQKKLLLECMSCHTLERVARSTFTAKQFVPILLLMQSFANNSTQLHPQVRVAPQPADPALVRQAAAYLATVNLSARPRWGYPLKTLPRPSGRATRVIIKEYDLPRAATAPHDIYRDAQGLLWFSEFGDQELGMLDPKTGKTTEYPIPTLKPISPTGTLDLEPDADGNLWLALMFQGGVAKFDVRTKTFKVWRLPPALDGDAAQQSMVAPQSWKVDNKVWTNAVERFSILRLDLATGAYTLINPFKFAMRGHSHSPYGMLTDAANNLYFFDFNDENIVKIDAKTLAATIYPTPTQGSRPRRGTLDSQGRLWFAEFAGDRIGMFDTKEEQFTEWKEPIPWTAPYDAEADREGDVWSVTMADDRVLRLNPQTGETTDYLLPHQTNARKLFVDNSTNPPRIWIGNNHHAAIIEVEPLN